MKSLILIRHAKSSWEHDISDINRPLSQRGFDDANLLSNEFLKNNFSPDAIFSSPANRALTTCHIFMDHCNLATKLLTIDKNLYDFGGLKVTNFIKSLDNHLQKVMIFGHNHAFTAVANKFGDVYIENVPTCGLVMVDFDVDAWKNIDQGHTELTLFPKDLK